MRAVVQRVSRAAVRVDGETVGAIGRGFVVLAGFAPTDTESTLAWMAEKVAPILPYLFLVLILIFRPKGLLGTRED